MSALRSLPGFWKVSLFLLAAVLGSTLITWGVTAASEEASAVVPYVQQALDHLTQPGLSDSAPEDQAQAVEAALDVLSGENGVIAYLEGVTGRSAEEFSFDSLETVLAGDGEPAAVQALSHLVVARDLLQTHPGASEIEEASEHIAIARELLELQ